MRQRLARIRSLLALVVVLVTAYTPWAGSQRAWAATPPVPRFDYSMERRLPYYQPQYGNIGIPQDPAYIQATTFPVTFQACSSTPLSGIVSFSLHIEGPGLATPWEQQRTSCAGFSPNLPQGAYTATLTVTDAAGVTASLTKTVTVNDYLIVAIGDSYGSGEGAPDLHGDYTIGGTGREALWMNERCHRSGWAGARQAAQRLEDADPHSSVTLVFVSCSGAQVGPGLLGQYVGAVNPGDGSMLDPQVTQVQNLVGNRPIDALVISIGGNDIGFADILTDCVANMGCRDHDTGNGVTEEQRFVNRLADLTRAGTGGYAQLSGVVASSLHPRHTYLTEYPNQFHANDGWLCSSILGDIIPGFMMDYDEIYWAEGVLYRLNQAMSDAASVYGWTFVDGIVEPFLAGHGYCASDNWIRTAQQATDIQGPFMQPNNTKGTMHPTERGQQVYADRIYAAVTADLTGFTVVGGPVTVRAAGPDIQPAPVALTFDNVSQAGVTSALPGLGGPLPDGYQWGNPARWYDVQTNATFTGNVKTCVDYAGETFANEAGLKILHKENGAWVDRTLSLDTGTKKICASTTSLSPFAVVQGNQPPTASAGGPYNVDEGGAVSLSGTGSDPDGDTLTYAWDLNNDGTFETTGQAATIAVGDLDGPASENVKLRVCDAASACATSTATVNIVNAAPAPAIGSAPASVSEGSAVSLTASATDPSAVDTAAGFTFDWSVTKNGAAFKSGAGASFSFTPDDNGAYAVTLSATDKDGATGQAAASVTATNAAPTPAIAGAPASVSEGSAVSLTASATDPSAADTMASFTFDWSVTKNGAAFKSGAGASFSFTPDDNGAYAVTLSATDKDGGKGQATVNVSANNVEPTPAIGGAPSASVPEGTVVTLTASATDPSAADTTAGFDFSWSVSKNNLPFKSGTGATLSFTPDDNGAYVVTLRATDKDAGSGQAPVANVMVTNLPPVLGAVTGPADPVKVGDSVLTNVSFTDPGAADTHTASWEWGDGGTSVGAVTESSGAVSGSHAYATPGVYTVQADVADDEAATATAKYQYVVVYDPNGGFVTGAGWLDSLAGAYARDPNLAGRASFGFVSKYQNGSSVPTGNTQFDFKVGNFSFRSTSYEWLVVAGARGQFKGEGAINGAGQYGFLLTAIDGQLSGGGGIDRFRIKIWDKATDAVVYDNQMNASADADPTTAIGGGQIVIHR